MFRKLSKLLIASSGAPKLQERRRNIRIYSSAIILFGEESVGDCTIILKNVRNTHHISKTDARTYSVLTQTCVCVCVCGVRNVKYALSEMRFVRLI